MRTARIKPDQWHPTYYHCIGRVAGEPDYRPFGIVEKEKLYTLLRRLTVFFTVEVLGFTVMSNHFHLVCYATPDLPSLDDVRQRCRAFHGPDAVEPQ